MNGMNIADRIDAVRAKRIHVFENGNTDSFGRLILVNSTRERTWNKVLTHVTQVLKPSYGIVHHLTTVDGKHSIQSFSELAHDARYVACGKEQFKKIKGGYRTEAEFNQTKKKKCLKLYTKKEPDENPAKYWALQQAQKNKRTVIYVFLNGHKHQAPVKFVLIESDLRNWLGTLSHISSKLDKPEGIRFLYTVFGHQVCGPCEVQHGACYVAVAFGEKFQQMEYMESYKEFLVAKRKTGECIKRYNIGAISSPLGLELRNDDCFFKKSIGEHKGEPSNEAKEFDEVSAISAQYFQKIAEFATKRKEKERPKSAPKDRPKSAPKDRKEKGQKQKETCSEVMKGTNTEIENPSLQSSLVDEVTVEAVGMKIVSNKSIDTCSQLTQTDDNNKLPQNSKLTVVNTSEDGIRLVGADEISKLKKNNKSSATSVTPLEENEIINAHTKIIREKLSQLSKMNDTGMMDNRDSAISFAYYYMNQDVKKDSKSTATDDHFSLINQRTLTTSTSSEEHKSGLVDTSRSVAIFEFPEIISNSNDYFEDDIKTECTERKSIIQRRSTGFNFKFNPYSVSALESGDEECDREELPNADKSSIETVEEEIEYTKKHSDVSVTSLQDESFDDVSEPSDESSDDVPKSSAKPDEGTQSFDVADDNLQTMSCPKVDKEILTSQTDLKDKNLQTTVCSTMDKKILTDKEDTVSKGQQCTKRGSIESGTSDGKRRAIAAEVKELLQKVNASMNNESSATPIVVGHRILADNYTGNNVIIIERTCCSNCKCTTEKN